MGGAGAEDAGEVPHLQLPGGPTSPQALQRVQDILLAAVGVAAVGVVLLLALVHLKDRSAADHVSGAWMAMTRYAQEGVLYPPLLEDGHYGGTRWMPVAIYVNLAFATLGSDLLVTGKLASLCLGTAILGLLYAMLRRLAVGRPMALALVGTAALSEPMLLALWAPYRGDSPAALLQLSAVAVMLWRSRAGGVLAGVLAGLAVLSKASAGWAPLAIGALLVFTDRRRLVEFALALGLVVAGGLGLFTQLSQGRIWENLLTLSTEQLSLRGLLGAAEKALIALEHSVQPLLLLLPLATVELVGAALSRRLGPHHLALAAAGLITWVVFADPGVYTNHLIDLVLLVALAVGALWARLARAPQAGWARGLVVAVVLTAAVAGYEVKVAPELKGWLRGTASHDLGVYARLASPGDRVLSEDPTVPVRLGQRPVVLDAFMWRRIEARRPELTAPLYRRVAAGEFDRVILLSDPEAGLRKGWYGQAHFSVALIRAIQARYRLEGEEAGYRVFVPRTRTSTAP
ncbi:MAG: hypothetical protein H6730_18365 [Deltaproteobacteria bacterium]|nr:hypothetical protein [Deltaproteobacteria bacterium]